MHQPCTGTDKSVRGSHGTTEQTQDQIQCALNQQQQVRISELEAERAATAQQIEARVQSALSKHQYQQQTQMWVNRVEYRIFYSK